MPDSPTADRSVRPARPDDAPAMGAVQLAAWREAYAGVLPDDLLATLDADELASTWEATVRQAASARHRVLVACEGPDVVGLAAFAPAGDPDLDPRVDAEVHALLVAPAARGRGHGSRLQQAVVDTLRGTGFARAHIWLGAGDLPLADFLRASGWDVDGARRTLDLHGDGSVTVPQQRMHTDLAPEGGDAPDAGTPPAATADS